MTPEEEVIRAAVSALADASPAVAAEELLNATNIFGPLSAAVRARVLALVANPGPDTWDDACTIILNSGPGTGFGITLWQAVMQVDPDCPRSGVPYRLGETQTPTQRWDGYTPDPMTVLSAIRVATGQHGTRPRQEPLR
jgi:hypothetical protein